MNVGEPTIYRWMRDGRMTFRKVGDSTRFLQEDLDAMVQVYRSKEKVNEVHEHCPLCRHTDLIDGDIQGTGHVYFRPGKAKFWTFLDSNIKTTAKMCTRCGAVQWYGDKEKLVAVKQEGE